MKAVLYGHARLRTADSVADELVDYAQMLSTRRRFAVVEIPIATDDGPGTAQLLIGPGVALAAVSEAPADETWRLHDGDSRDEFGAVRPSDPSASRGGRIRVLEGRHGAERAVAVAREHAPRSTATPFDDAMIHDTGLVEGEARIGQS